MKKKRETAVEKKKPFNCFLSPRLIHCKNSYLTLDRETDTRNQKVCGNFYFFTEH